MSQNKFYFSQQNFSTAANDIRIMKISFILPVIEKNNLDTIIKLIFYFTYFLRISIYVSDNLIFPVVY